MAGPTVFVSRPDHWATIFSLGVSLTGEIGIVQESTAYLISVYALAVPEVPVRKALNEYTQTLTASRQGSLYTCTATIGTAAQVHVSPFLRTPLKFSEDKCWSPLEEVHKAMEPAFDLNFAHGNYEIATCEQLSGHR